MKMEEIQCHECISTFTAEPSNLYPDDFGWLSVLHVVLLGVGVKLMAGMRHRHPAQNVIRNKRKYT